MLEPSRRARQGATLGSACELPDRAPVALWIFAVALGVLAIVISPATLIALGPMRESLTADNELTRQTALTTVRLGRALVSLGAVGIVALILSWGRFAKSRWVAEICRQAPPAEASNDGPVFNRSFRISVGTFAASLAYIALAPALLSDQQRTLLGREDGILEQTTALLFLGSSILSMRVAFRLFQERTPTSPSTLRRVIWHVLIGLFFFLCFGEEISWGQRILGFETPESMKQLNVQEEANLHNMMGYFADHLFILGMFVYGSVLPFVASRYEFWKRSLSWIGLPLASLGLAVGFALSSGIHDWTLYAVLPRGAGVRAAELREFLTALCCALLMFECRARLRRREITATD